jgi:hypothetical protein
VAAAPTSIDLGTHRDLTGRTHEVWLRRALLVLVTVLPVLGLLSLFGQRMGVSSVSSPAATLSVKSPGALRGGLLFTVRFQIVAHQSIKHATLVLGQNWLDGMTINGIEPSPGSEESRHGRLVLFLGPISAGETWNEYLSLQVNPTTIGDREGSVALYNGQRRLLLLTRTATVFP